MWVLASVAALLAVLIVPPLVSVSRYKNGITRLLSTSLGRPVRLSSVEVRLLPWPGFVLSDLTVEDDPAYSNEPILHANTVKASIRLLSLWRGRLEVGEISVDEASLNLVRGANGHWNLDSLFRTPVVRGGARSGARLPYLSATNSRINIKNGLEKLPFSLTDTDLSFWQENSGEWRLRLLGQPDRTDLPLQSGDTGTVRLEASLRPAASLRQMPLHLDAEWREAQLGQLSRLIAGTDPGWRGDLRGEFHLDGTAESALVKTRLRAAGVHRAEFTPASPLDFDARCESTYRLMDRSLEKLTCESPLGNGQIRVRGDLPGAARRSALPTRLSVELDHIPVAAGLDALRTVRSGFAPGAEARGSISGHLEYAEAQPEPEAVKSAKHGIKNAPVAGPLTGSLSVEGFQLSGGSLSAPVEIPKLSLEPAADDPKALAATATIPAGAATPLNVSARIALTGYQVSVRGQATVMRAREFAHFAGASGASLLDAMAGDPLSVDLNAQGPWLPVEKNPLSPASKENPAAGDQLAGTVTLHNVNWKTDYLVNHVVISQAVLHLSADQLNWEPIVFSYGPVKGTATVSIPADCQDRPACLPHFAVQFAQLDASALQAAVLGAQEKVTFIASLLDKLHSTTAPVWPHLEGSVKADSLVVGPLTLRDAVAQVKLNSTGAEVSSFEAATLGGHMHGTGSLTTPRNEKDKPAYSFEGSFEKLNPGPVGQLLDQRWTGGSFDAKGKVELSGYTQADLAASAKGTLHFDWQKGAVAGSSPDLAHFDRWEADAEIAGGSIQLKQNAVKHGQKTASVAASATLGAGARAAFAKSGPATGKH
jgi:hypothetical protein